MRDGVEAARQVLARPGRHHQGQSGCEGSGTRDSGGLVVRGPKLCESLAPGRDHRLVDRAFLRVRLPGAVADVHRLAVALCRLLVHHLFPLELAARVIDPGRHRRPHSHMPGPGGANLLVRRRPASRAYVINSLAGLRMDVRKVVG